MSVLFVCNERNYMSHLCGPFLGALLRPCAVFFAVSALSFIIYLQPSIFFSSERGCYTAGKWRLPTEQRCKCAAFAPLAGHHKLKLKLKPFTGFASAPPPPPAAAVGAATGPHPCRSPPAAHSSSSCLRLPPLPSLAPAAAVKQEDSLAT